MAKLFEVFDIERESIGDIHKAKNPLNPKYMVYGGCTILFYMTNGFFSDPFMYL